jgi:hypothetical protein
VLNLTCQEIFFDVPHVTHQENTLKIVREKKNDMITYYYFFKKYYIHKTKRTHICINILKNTLIF